MLPSPQMRIPHLLLLLGLPACQLHRPLDVPAWSHARVGQVGWFAVAGLANDHHAETTITFDTNFGEQEIILEPELLGEFGLSLGAEVFVAEDWSLQLGYDLRQFGARDTPGFLFDTVTSESWFFHTRWHVPCPFGEGSRWRPFVQGRLAYLPNTSFESEVDLSSINQPNPEYKFDGSPYWNAGLAVGLEYQLRSDLVFQVGVNHEWALEPTTDRVHLEFLPGFEVDLDTSIEPEGTMLMIGLTWYP